MRVRVQYQIHKSQSREPIPEATVMVGGREMRRVRPRRTDPDLRAPDYATVVGMEARAFAGQMRRMVRARWRAYLRVLGLRGVCRYLVVPVLSRWRVLTAVLSLVTLLAGVVWLREGWSVDAWVFTAVIGVVGAMFSFFVDLMTEWIPPPRVRLCPQRVEHWHGRELRSFPAVRAELWEGKETTRATGEPDLDLLAEEAVEQYAESALRNLLPKIHEYEDSVKMQRQMHRFLRAGR